MTSRSIPFLDLDPELVNIQKTFTNQHSLFFEQSYQSSNINVNHIKTKIADLEKQTITLPFHELPGKHPSSLFIELNPSPPGQIITSMRINDFSNIRSIRLEIGGTRFDYLENDIIPVLQKQFHFQDNEIPFLILKDFLINPKYHSIRLWFTFFKDDDYTNIFEYDYYQHDIFNTLTHFDYQFMNLLFTGEEYRIDKQLQLNFINNMSYLFVENVFEEEPYLQLNEKLYQLTNNGIIDGYKLYDFTKSSSGVPFGINLSMIDHCRLRFQKPVGRIRCYAVNLECFKLRYGLTGMVFR
jgi:hypothetical protein